MKGFEIPEATHLLLIEQDPQKIKEIQKLLKRRCSQVEILILRTSAEVLAAFRKGTLGHIPNAIVLGDTEGRNDILDVLQGSERSNRTILIDLGGENDLEVFAA